MDPTRLLLYPPHMAAVPVQISMDQELLQKIDSDPEAKEQGRSAFVRSAIRLYLTAKERRDVEASLHQAYAGKADALLAEIEDLMGDQAWPND